MALGIASEKIKVLYTSDVHGHAMPIIYGSNEEADLGLVKYATIVEEARKKNPNLIVLDNGDLIQGTPLMTHYVKEHRDKINPMIGLMNQIDLDAAAIGNHEFNFGDDVLMQAVGEAEFPWLSANIVYEQTGKPVFGSPYMIKDFPSGIKVGIVGVTTHYIPNWESPDHIQGMRFEDSFQALEKWVQHIHKVEKPDVLIALYHGGFERDLETGEPTETLTGENQGYDMCQNIEGIDVLLTGHQHRTLTGKINDVLVIQPGKNGEMYGEIDIEVTKHEDEWQVTDKSATLRNVKGVESNPKALQYMNRLEASTQQWLDEPIGKIAGDMIIRDAFEARVKKHPFIQFIQQVQMDASGANISTTSLFSEKPGSGFSSNVTMREVVSNYIYPNTLVVLELSKDDIIAALEKSAEYFTLDHSGYIAVNPTYISPKPQHYNYDMWEGIEYTINVAKPIGERIENVTYHGEPLKEDEKYHVVLNNYRAIGGGNFDMFKDKRVVKEIRTEISELIRTYFEKNETVEALLTKNYTVKAE